MKPKLLKQPSRSMLSCEGQVSLITRRWSSTQSKRRSMHKQKSENIMMMMIHLVTSKRTKKRRKKSKLGKYKVSMTTGLLALQSLPLTPSFQAWLCQMNSLPSPLVSSLSHSISRLLWSISQGRRSSSHLNEKHTISIYKIIQKNSKN